MRSVSRAYHRERSDSSSSEWALAFLDKGMQAPDSFTDGWASLCAKVRGHIIVAVTSLAMRRDTIFERALVLRW